MKQMLTIEEETKLWYFAKSLQNSLHKKFYNIHGKFVMGKEVYKLSTNNSTFHVMKIHIKYFY